MNRYNHVMSILITDYMDGQQKAAGLADYVRDLKASHDALLSAARRFNSMAEHIMLNRPVRDMAETMVEVLTAIANAERLT